MQKSKKKLFDTNDSIRLTPEDALREWQDKLDDIERENALREQGIETIKVEIAEEDYDDWCEYMQKFYKEIEKIDRDNEIAQQQKSRPT